jgi:hypothetical protein
VPRSVRSEIEIDAPVGRVWSVLTDLERYAEWNPFTARAESTLRVGDPIDLYPRLVGRRAYRWTERVTRNAPYELCWEVTLGARVLLYAERCQTLTARGGDRTHYATEDRFEGLLTPLVLGLFGRAMQRGFDDCAAGLKKRAESGGTP